MNKAVAFSLAAEGDRLRVNGVLDFTAAARMTPALRECIGRLPETFTVDLSCLNDFNSAVLVFMLDCIRLSAESKKHCQFTGATAALTNMLSMASLDDLEALPQTQAS